MGVHLYPGAARNNPTLRASLRYGSIDGTLYSLMVGIGESYVQLFVLAATLSVVASGLIATVPLLLGAVLQLSVPWAVRRFGTLRRWIVFAATLQAVALVPLAVMAVAGRAPIWAVFGAVTAYWGASLGCGAAWNTWIGMIVPRRIRARYFSFKSRIANLANLAGLVAGGVILEELTGDNAHLWPFAILFLIGAGARGVCAYYLHRQTDTGPVPDHHRHIGPIELLRRLRGGHDGRFIVYLVLMQAGVQIGQPFFAPFMRAQLELDYVQILALTAAGMVSRAAMQPLWGAYAHRHGAGRLLWIGGIGIIPHSALLLVSPSFAYLIVAQLAAGAMWSAYELAILLLTFERVAEEDRTSMWSIYNVLNSAAMVLGSFVGAWVLRTHGGWEGFKIAFLLSVAVRLVTVLYLLRGRGADGGAG